MGAGEGEGVMRAAIGSGSGRWFSAGDKTFAPSQATLSGTETTFAVRDKTLSHPDKTFSASQKAASAMEITLSVAETTSLDCGHDFFRRGENSLPQRQRLSPARR